MRILVLNGSPHANGATSDMVSAFSIGAMEAGHEVISINVAHKNIKGCMACEYCREKEKGIWIYYFTLSTQLQAVIHRTYSIDIPKNVKKVALIMSSGSAYVYGPAITQYYQSIVEYWGVENAGIYTANGKQNKSEEKRQELYRFGKSL